MMSVKNSKPLSGERMKKAVQELSELLADHPEKKRAEVLRMVALKCDLSPLECEFLNKNFSDKT